MRARDIMTTPVVTIGPDTSIAEIAALLSEHGFSGVPVVDAKGALIGIVSEGDLIHHAAIGAEPKGKWWLASLANPDAIARAYAKAHGRRASNVMTRRVATISDEAELSAVAAAFDAQGVKRLPVSRDGHLAGVITRSDLIRALASADASGDAVHRENATVQKAILDKLAEQAWLDGSYVNVQVGSTSVELRGLVASEDQRQALHAIVSEAGASRQIDDKLAIGVPVVSEFT